MKMTEEKYIELINKEVDGLISAKEKHQLHEYLKEDLKAKDLYEETVKSSELLKQVNEAEPSANLKKRILNSIDINRYETENLEKTVRPSLAERFKDLNPGYGYSFAAGVVIGLIVFSLFLTDMIQENELDNINFYGTIGIPESENIQELDQVSLDLPGITGTIKLFRFNKIVWFDIKTITSDRCEMVFNFDQTKISFNGYKPLNYSNTFIENEKDKVTVTLSENRHFLLLLSQKSTENTQVSLKIAHTAQEPFTYTFQIKSEDKQ